MIAFLVNLVFFCKNFGMENLLSIVMARKRQVNSGGMLDAIAK